MPWLTPNAPVTVDVPVMVMVPVPTLVADKLLIKASLKRRNWLPTLKEVLSNPSDNVATVGELLVTTPEPAREPISALLPFRLSTVPLAS